MRRVAVRSKHMGRPRMRISFRLAFFAASFEVASSVYTEGGIRPFLCAGMPNGAATGTLIRAFKPSQGAESCGLLCGQTLLQHCAVLRWRAAYSKRQSPDDVDIPVLPSLFPSRGFVSSELFFFFSISTSLAIQAIGRHIT